MSETTPSLENKADKLQIEIDDLNKRLDLHKIYATYANYASYRLNALQDLVNVNVDDQKQTLFQMFNWKAKLKTEHNQAIAKVNDKRSGDVKIEDEDYQQIVLTMPHHKLLQSFCAELCSTSEQWRWQDVRFLVDFSDRYRYMKASYGGCQSLRNVDDAKRKLYNDWKILDDLPYEELKSDMNSAVLQRCINFYAKDSWNLDLLI